MTLAGHVESYSEKRSAERAVQCVSGVKALAVEMDVRLPGLSKRTDGDIARSAESALRWSVFLPKEAVKLKVENGWVTLTGNVEWQYQRESASHVIRHLQGVTGVSDDIDVKSKVSSTAVKADIEAALKRRATADAHKIKVDVKGADVTLTGTVGSWSERELANYSAWGTPGVNKVVDKLTMAY